MAASSSTEIPQSLEITNIFEACINELNKLCDYYNANTSAPDLFGRTFPLSENKRSGVRSLLTNYLAILFYELMAIKKAQQILPQSENTISFALEVMGKSLTILARSGTQKSAAAKWIQAYLRDPATDYPYPEPLPYHAEELNKEPLFNLINDGRIKEYLKTYMNIYKAHVTKIAIHEHLLPALIWFFNSSKEDTLLLIKTNAAKLYLYAGSDEQTTEKQIELNEKAFKQKQLSTALSSTGEIILTGLLAIDDFPETLWKVIMTGEADRRNKRAIELLDAQTPVGLFTKVFEQSRNPNRKAMTFALLIAIIWSFKSKEPEDKLHQQSYRLYFLRNWLAPIAREIIVAGKQYYETNTALVTRDDADRSDNIKESIQPPRMSI